MERLNPAPYADHFLTFPEESRATNDLTSHEPQSEPVYHTGIGSVTFEQLYQKTSRTVGYVMRERHGMTNPEDIDDCMQAGYLKVWQQLQKNPDCFADKPKRYLVQAIVFRSKAQRFSHQRYYHKIVYDADAEKQRSVSIMTTDQVDTWIDLEQAISHVAHQVEDKQEALLGLYCLITQATVQDIAATFGYGYSTLTAYKRQVKGELAAALDGYAPKSYQSRVVLAQVVAVKLFRIAAVGNVNSDPQLPFIGQQIWIIPQLLPQSNKALLNTIFSIFTVQPQAPNLCVSRSAHLRISDDLFQRHLPSPASSVSFRRCFRLFNGLEMAVRRCSRTYCCRDWLLEEQIWLEAELENHISSSETSLWKMPNTHVPGQS